ncbi:hypothetical protein [Polaromonas sp. CG9_12]|nr:hypothetical protein [Polaromonas sp. CG9_12]
MSFCDVRFEAVDVNLTLKAVGYLESQANPDGGHFGDRYFGGVGHPLIFFRVVQLNAFPSPRKPADAGHARCPEANGKGPSPAFSHALARPGPRGL